MFSIRGDCGHCRQQVDFKVVFVASLFPDTESKSNKIQGDIRGFNNPRTATLLCPLCGENSLIRFTAGRDDFLKIFKAVDSRETLLMSHLQVEDKVYFPSIPSPKDHDKWPQKIVEGFLAVDKNVRAGDPASLTLTSIRSVLQGAIKLLEVPDKDTLFKQIEFLRQNGIITEGMKEWAHALRLDGNKGTHELGGEQSEAIENLAFLRQFLDLCFTLPATIEERKAKAKAADTE